MKFVFISLCWLLFFSCNAQKEQDFLIIRDGFYIKKSTGKIFFKKFFIKEIDNQFLEDSTFSEIIKYSKNNSNFISSISNFLDTQTIHVLDSQMIFFCDKKYVYYFHASSDGGDLYLVDNADSKSFGPICFEFSKDKKNVYYRNHKLIDLNPLEIKCLFDNRFPTVLSYIKDNKNVYYRSAKIFSADANTFELINNKNADAKDKNHFPSGADSCKQ